MSIVRWLGWSFLVMNNSIDIVNFFDVRRESSGGIWQCLGGLFEMICGSWNED